MKIIIVNGQGGVGKTRFELKIKKEFEKRGKTCDIFSTIDYVKEAAVMLGWKGEKSEKGRRFLSNLKSALKDYNDSPFLNICSKIDHSQSDICFVDCREPEEIERLKNHFSNVFTILITRGEKKDYGNESDNNVFNYKYDYYIDNNGSLEDFDNMAINFAKHLGDE